MADGGVGFSILDVMDNGLNNSSTNEQVIAISSVSKAFGSRLVLKNVELGITRGEGVCICGINGAGKSTLIKILLGLLEPTSGSATMLGYDVARQGHSALQADFKNAVTSASDAYQETKKS